MQELNPEIISETVRRALTEDIPEGDITTEALLKAAGKQKITAEIVQKESGVICGLLFVKEVFKQLDAAVKVEQLKEEGGYVSSGLPVSICRVSGSAAAILAGERVALNFLQHLSGVATLTAQFVKSAAGTGAKIYDTRKTLPGLRAAQKYAVRVGGGTNHRMSLSAEALLKENHIAICEMRSLPVQEYIRRLKEHIDERTKIGIEVNSIEELRDALEYGVDYILLDNFSTGELRSAVAFARTAAVNVALEASGNITIANIAEVAATGVNRISVGALTHSIAAIDFSLDVIRS